MVKFGFACIPRVSATETVSLFRRGEELGFNALWLPDQTFYYDPFSLLGALGATTSRIELGVGVANPFSRHPVQLARAAHALTDLTGGRFTLAVGAGNRKELLDKLNIEQSRIAPRTREAVKVMKALLRGETVNAETEFFSMTDVRLESPRVAQPSVLMAARAPRMLRAAGEVADGAIVECLLTPSAVNWAREQIRGGAARSDRELVNFRYVAWGIGLLVDDPKDVPEAVRNLTGHLLAVMPDNLLTLLGLDLEKMTRLKADYNEKGPPAAGRYIGEAELSAVTFVGTPESVRQRFQTLADIGVNEISVLLLGGTLTENLANLEALAKQGIS